MFDSDNYYDFIGWLFIVTALVLFVLIKWWPE